MDVGAVVLKKKEKLNQVTFLIHHCCCSFLCSFENLIILLPKDGEFDAIRILINNEFVMGEEIYLKFSSPLSPDMNISIVLFAFTEKGLRSSF